LRCLTGAAEKLWERFGGQLHANAHELRPKLAAIPDMSVYPQNPPTIRIGGQVTKSLYQFTMASPDQEELYASAQSLIGEISRIQGVQDVATDLAIAAPQVTVHIDRDKAAAMQINAQQIENALYDAFGPRWVSTIYGAATSTRCCSISSPSTRPTRARSPCSTSKRTTAS